MQRLTEEYIHGGEDDDKVVKQRLLDETEKRGGMCERKGCRQRNGGWGTTLFSPNKTAHCLEWVKDMGML